MNDSKPAACPACIFWIILRIATPRPKNTLKTMPSAASSLTRVYLRISSTQPIPTMPVTSPPSSSAGSDLPVPPA